MDMEDPDRYCLQSAASLPVHVSSQLKSLVGEGQAPVVCERRWDQVTQYVLDCA